MRRTLLPIALSAVVLLGSRPAPGCTSLLVTKGASADGSTFITYTFRDDLPNHLRHRAYDQALARLKADWPDTSQVYVATTGQGYAVRCPREYLNCTRNNDSPCSRCSRP